MNKEQYTYIIRYGVAAIAVAALCAPVVWRTEAMPSVSDVWGYRAVAALAVLALTTAAPALGRRRGLVLVGLRFAELCVRVALSGCGGLWQGHGLGSGLRSLAVGYPLLRKGFYPALVGRTVCGRRL